MGNDTAVEALRRLIDRVASYIGGSATHRTLDGELARYGLPPSQEEGTKAQRAESSVKALTDDQLPGVARLLLDSCPSLDAVMRNELQDLLWARRSQVAVSKRVRRDLARALPWDELQTHYARLVALLDSLFVLDDDPVATFMGTEGNSLRGRLNRHVGHNEDWSVEDAFEALGAFESSDPRFKRLLEGIVSADTLPDEAAQRRLVKIMNSVLTTEGLELRETGTADGYPTFALVATRSHAGRPKNLIFASPDKPDLRVIDGIDNDIEIVSNAEKVLIYDCPLTTEGVRWRDLQDWWKAKHQLDSDEKAKVALYQRLYQSMPAESPPQRRLFYLYHEIHRENVHDLPALLPEVWLHWDPKTVKARGPAALLNLRMDFLMLMPGGARIVLEVDGKIGHYATGNVPDPALYARTMAGTRKLTLRGYEVYRFGAYDLHQDYRAQHTVAAFFAELFEQHGIASATGAEAGRLR